MKLNYAKMNRFYLWAPFGLFQTFWFAFTVTRRTRSRSCPVSSAMRISMWSPFRFWWRQRLPISTARLPTRSVASRPIRALRPRMLAPLWMLWMKRPLLWRVIPCSRSYPINKLGSDQTFHHKKMFGSRVGTQTQNQNQFGFGFRIYFYTFWYGNRQKFKILNTHKFLGLKNVRKIKKNFFKNFQNSPDICTQ